MLLYNKVQKLPGGTLTCNDSDSVQMLFDYFHRRIWRTLNTTEQSVLLQAAFIRLNINVSNLDTPDSTALM